MATAVNRLRVRSWHALGPLLLVGLFQLMHKSYYLLTEVLQLLDDFGVSLLHATYMFPSLDLEKNPNARLFPAQITFLEDSYKLIGNLVSALTRVYSC